MSNRDNLVFECALRHFKRRPELVVLRNKKAEEVIWQAGFQHFWLTPFGQKPKESEGVYLGRIQPAGEGVFEFFAKDPRKPDQWVTLRGLSYGSALAAAYLLHKESCGSLPAAGATAP